MSIKASSSGGQSWTLRAGAALGAGATAFQPYHYVEPPPVTASQSPPTSATANFVDERLLEARLRESEARLELRFSDRLGKIADQIAALAGTVDRMDSKYDALSTKLDHKAGIGTVWGAAASAVITGLLAVLAIMSWGNDRLQTGIAIASSPGASKVRSVDVVENAPAPVLLPPPSNTVKPQK